MAGATAGGRAGTAAAIKRRRKKEALNQVGPDTDSERIKLKTVFFLFYFFQVPHEEKVDKVLLTRFQHFDENNEGKVSKDELKKMLNAKGMK